MMKSSFSQCEKLLFDERLVTFQKRMLTLSPTDESSEHTAILSVFLPKAYPLMVLLQK